MSILDQLSSIIGGSSKEGGNVLESIIKMISNTEGGLGAIVSKFTKGGFGDIVNSWVGTGENKPISTDQLSSVLGHGELQTIAEKTGLPLEDATQKVSELLPGIVDKLTPNGKVGKGNILEKGMDILKGLFH